MEIDLGSPENSGGAWLQRPKRETAKHPPKDQPSEVPGEETDTQDKTSADDQSIGQTAKAFDETKHPRDPGGEGGGQFVSGGGVAEGTKPGKKRGLLTSKTPNKVYTATSPVEVTPTPEESAKIKGPQPGHCFDSAALYIAHHKTTNAVLVHGSIVVGHTKIAHGWAEIPRADGSTVVYDGVQAKFYTKDSYVKNLKAKAQHTYTLAEARVANKASGHLGPWEDDLEGLVGKVAS